MTNELLLILSVMIIFGGVLVFYYFFGRTGLYAWTVFSAITANIEVLILINAFGMEQTLGNIMFASSFLVTDILSETGSEKEAKTAVYLGIFTSVIFIFVSQLWLHFIPSPNDLIMPSIRAIFSNTPRLMLTSLAVYLICQQFDVWAYHKWWSFTTRLCGDHERFLWVRNNGSTMISQLLNTILFTFGAFLGVYPLKTLISLILSTYLIYLVTSLIDTPFIYIARKITPRCT